MDTIYILWIRQLKKYVRSRSRIIGSLGQPLLFLVAFGYGFGSIYKKAGDGSYIQFLAPGVICMSVLFTAMFSGIDLIWDRQFGFLKETLVAPVSRFQIVLGKTIGGATVAVIQGLIVFLLTLFVGFKPVNLIMLIPSTLFLFLIALLFTCLGIVIASTLEDMQGFQLIMNFLVMPIVFLSGAFFPLVGLPAAISFIAKINPLTYGIDGLRGAMTGLSSFGMMPDFIVLALVTAFLLSLGSYLFEKIQV